MKNKSLDDWNALYLKLKIDTLLCGQQMKKVSKAKLIGNKCTYGTFFKPLFWAQKLCTPTKQVGKFKIAKQRKTLI